jgi:hypothetical protein
MVVVKQLASESMQSDERLFMYRAHAVRQPVEPSLVSSSHKSDLLFDLVHPSAMQSSYGVDIYMFMLSSFPAEMFWPFLPLMPVIALHTSNVFLWVKSSVL